jgi:hypothetical protein
VADGAARNPDETTRVHQRSKASWVVSPGEEFR